MKFPSREEFDEAVKTMMEGEPLGVTYFKTGEVRGIEGKPVAIVLGWSDDYEEGEQYQKTVDDKLYTLVGKVAYNCDDLQCDYDWDWYMPSYESCPDVREIYDTDHAIYEGSYEYLVKEAKYLLEDGGFYWE